MYYDKKENITYFNFSASRFEASFYDAKVSATIITTNIDNKNNKPFLSVLVDYEGNIDKSIVIELNKPKQNIVLIDESFLPITKEKKLKIEIYGDFLTCGY